MRPPSITTSYGEPAGTGAKAPGPAFGPHARTTHAISATRVIEVLLPGAVFTHVGNHASEPVGGIAPVGLHGALRRIRVSRFDRPDNDVVLGNRGRDLIHQRVDVDAHVALGLRLDAVMEGQQTGPGGAVHVQRMELAVEAGDAVGVRPWGHRNFEELAVQSAQRADEWAPLWRREGRGAARGEPLDFGVDVEQLRRVLAGQRRDRRPSASPRGRGEDVSFLREPQQRGANRGATNPESAGQLRLDQPGAGGETPSHDQLPQPPVRGGDPVVTGGGFRRFRHRPPFIPPRRDTRKAIFVSLAGYLPRRYNDLPTMKTGTMTLRNLDRWRDFEACVELQRDTWGRDFSACVPAAVLMVAQRVGGVTAGAFDAEGRLQGFIFGLTGYSGGRPMHWSHMLAVRERARDAGLGIRLKLYQRKLLLKNGVDTARWTFDPLVAKNAHINLNRLGAVVVEHVENMYGDSNSTLHAGLGTDRFVAEWRLADERVGRVIAGLESARGESSPGSPVRVEIPADIYDVLGHAPREAVQWRVRTRAAFRQHLAQGYRVMAFDRDPASGRCFYGLA